MSTTYHKMHLCGLGCLSKLFVHSSFDAISFLLILWHLCLQVRLAHFCMVHFQLQTLHKRCYKKFTCQSAISLFPAKMTLLKVSKLSVQYLPGFVLMSTLGLQEGKAQLLSRLPKCCGSEWPAKLHQDKDSACHALHLYDVHFMSLFFSLFITC